MLLHRPWPTPRVAGNQLPLARRAASLVLLCAACLAAAEQPALVVDRLEVDGKSQRLPASPIGEKSSLRLAPGPHQLLFGFGPPEAEGPPLRLRYRLEGVDKEWVEAGGEMRLTLMVFNAAGEVLGLFESPMRGDSAGWSNDFAHSQFTAREESFQLPPGAASLRVIFNSGTWDTRDGASHPTVGMAMIDDCWIWVKGADGKKRNIWPNPTFDEGENLDQPDGHPRAWMRGAFGQQIAQVLTLPGPQGRVLALVDNNPRSGSEWRCDLNLQGVASAGSSLTAEWKELFTVGAAGGHTADYHYVPPGECVFRVKAVTPRGEPTSHEASLAFSIPQVFWKTTPFLVLSGSGVAALIATTARSLTRRRMRRELERLEQQRALERERTRIARDIHDDLGTSLTRVTLLSQAVRGAVPPESPAAQEIEQIRRTSQEMTRTLEEIVWAVDPAHDSLDSIANYLGRFAQDFLSTAGMSCRLDLPVQLPSQPISAEVRHNLFLAFKEVLNNAVRHSGASEVKVILAVAEQHFTLTIADDGKGMASTAAHSATREGHGLLNIRNRLAQIGGAAEVTSQPGQGTLVRLTVPLAASALSGRQN
jgi:signal transduction histidine kinase